MGTLAVDERLVKQVLVNLISNAAKFTPRMALSGLAPCYIKRTKKLNST
ncbi:MAG: hypothetical protein OEV42_11735 [Deltaproteobacteria bacterium]|nr:hypothetical protein [Deltaproteobacteria bacterium]